jgi:hypothetical protein
MEIGENIMSYGFNSNCDEEKLIDFIKEHKEAFCKSDREKKLYNDMLNYTESEYNLEDFFEDYSCDNTGMTGLGAVIANIMSRETGIRFAYCQPESIVIDEKYPWLFNETEKELTEEKLSNICKKYMDELGVVDNPDYLNLEYYR